MVVVDMIGIQCIIYDQADRPKARRFTFNKLKEHFDKQNEEAEKQQNMLKNKQTSSKEISRPNIAPTYTTSKAPKK